MTRVLVSRCLGLAPCRYNGEMIEAPWIRALAVRVELLSVCPEAEIGLGVPRDPINLVRNNKGVRLIQYETGIDLSEVMVSFSQGYLRFLGDVDAFILKSKSPSCGLGTTKIYKNDSFTLGSGVFASIAEKLYPDSVFVDEKYMEEKGVDGLLGLINKN